jgi:hypothetical protein
VINDLAKRVIGRHERMVRDRGTFDAVFQELRELCRPDTNDFNSGSQVPGDARRRIYDGTAPWCADMLASGLHSYLSNPVDRWFSLGIPGMPLQELAFEEKAWLEKVADKMYSHYSAPGSGLNPALHECYMDLSTFGTSAIYHWLDDRRLKFRSYPLSTVFIDEDSKGDVNVVHRIIKWTVEQVEQEFGQLTAKLAKMKGTDQVTVIHSVSQNEGFEQGQRGHGKRRWKSCYVCKDTNEVLDESGLDWMPYLVPRWTKLCGEKYGRGPAMSVLPEIRMVNAMSKTMIIAAQKMVDPPLMVEDDGYMLPIKSSPGGVNIRRPGAGPIEALPSPQRIDIGIEMIEQRREMIRRGFYVDWIVRGQKKERQTAFEVSDERNQMLSLMAPIVGRLQEELLGRMLTLSFNYLARDGQLEDAPDSIVGIPLEVAYISPAARAQSTARGQGMLAYVQQISQLAPVMPGILDSVDEDGFNAELQDQLDVPRRVLLSPDAVKQKRAAREQANQQAQMAQVGPAMAKSAKDLAQAQQTGLTLDI